MTRTLTIAAIAALILLTASAEARCIRGSDTVNCFAEPFAVVAFGEINVANFYAKTELSDFQRRYAFILTTNDQTRRALVVFPLTGSAPAQPNADRYVAEIFFTRSSQEETDLLDRRYDSLNDDQRAGSFRVPTDLLSGGTVLIYRTFTPFTPVFAPIVAEAKDAR